LKKLVGEEWWGGTERDEKYEEKSAGPVWRGAVGCAWVEPDGFFRETSELRREHYVLLKMKIQIVYLGISMNIVMVSLLSLSKPTREMEGDNHMLRPPIMICHSYINQYEIDNFMLSTVKSAPCIRQPVIEACVAVL
jgi:hypothetical protein